MRKTLFFTALMLPLILAICLPNTFAQYISHTVLRGHSDSVNSVVFSPDGSILTSGSSDETIRLWNSKTGALIRTLTEEDTSGVYSVVFSPDGSMLASGSSDGTIRLWNPKTGAHIRTWGY